MIKNEGWCPVFKGFYGNICEDEADNAEDDFREYGIYNTPCIIEQFEKIENSVITDPIEKMKIQDAFTNQIKKIDINEFFSNNINYETYEAEVSKKILEYIGDKLYESGYISDYSYENISSPNYYNFSNDSINCTWDISEENKNNIIEKITDNSDWGLYLESKYTSRAGFISHYSNQVEDWTDWDEIMEDSHRFSSVLEFLCELEEIDDVYYDDVIEKVPIFEHIYYDKLDCIVQKKLMNEYYDDCAE